jgi:hypothetical protein
MDREMEVKRNDFMKHILFLMISLLVVSCSTKDNNTMGLFDKLFGRSKKINQENEKSNIMDPNDLWFSTPTISNEFPQTSPKTKDTEFDINIHEDDYRQHEFLNSSALLAIELEFKEIKEIWDNHSKKTEDYTLFKNCHVRKTIGLPNLSINFSELKTLLKFNSVGQVIIDGNTLVKGFTFKTENTTYFGTLKDDQVIELCIAQWNEETKNEILKINKAFNLLFVNWYHIEMIKNEAN